MENFQRFLFCASTFILLNLSVISAGISAASDAANQVFFLALRNDLTLVREQIWKDSSAHYCTWSGVTCIGTDTGANVTLSLGGTIPDDTQLGIPDPSKSYYDNVDWNLVLVTDIYINGSSNIVGTLNSEWKKFISLRRVDFRNTGVSGTLPGEFDRMKNLTYINLDGCTSLCGTLPNLALPSLEELHLSGIGFRGTLPTAWGGMTSLRTIDLTGSNPCGCIPVTYYSNTVLLSYFSTFAVGSATCATTNQCSSCDGVCGTPSGCVQCNVQRCRTCSSTNICSVCSGGLTPTSNTCPICSVQYCSSCYSATQCITCSGTYSPSTDRKTCVQCLVDNCNSCTSTNTCGVCSPGYTLSEGRCILCTTSGCSKCANEANVCTECSSSAYSLVDGKCVSCNVENCKTCETADTCSVCGNGNLPSDGKCPSCDVVNCQYCDTDDVCSGCNGGYTLIAQKNTCVLCSTENCETCGALGQCVACKDGYNLLDYACVECNIGKCELCSTPNFCVQCPDGYRLNTNGDECVQCNVDNCLTCSSDGVCGACSYPYTLANGACVLCDIVNCVSCLEENICSACASSLKPSADGLTCLTCDLEKCDACSSDNSCVACAIDDCRNCDATNECGTCRNGYGVSENTCVRCTDENCQTCSGADGSHCLVYLPGYEVEETATAKVIPYWVWIIVGIGAFLIFVLICFLIAYCCCGCCHRKKKYNIVYLEDMEGHPLAEKARRLQGIKYRARSPHDSSEATSSNSGGSENQLSASSTESGASDEGAHLVSVESPHSEEHYYRQTFAEDDPNAVYNTFHM